MKHGKFWKKTQDLPLSQHISLVRVANVQSIKEYILNSDFIKMKISFPQKAQLRERKDKPQSGRNICRSYESLVSRIQDRLLTQCNKHPSQLKKKKEMIWTDSLPKGTCGWQMSTWKSLLGRMRGVYITSTITDLLKQEESVKQKEEPAWTLGCVSRACPSSPFKDLRHLLRGLMLGPVWWSSGSSNSLGQWEAG